MSLWPMNEHTSCFKHSVNEQELNRILSELWKRLFYFINCNTVLKKNTVKLMLSLCQQSPNSTAKLSFSLTFLQG